MFAKSIPPAQRRLIDKNYLQTIDAPSHENDIYRRSFSIQEPTVCGAGIGSAPEGEDEVFAEHYDVNHLYFK